MARYPTNGETREEFFDSDDGTYLLSFRLTQTGSSGRQVEIQELAEFYAEVLWVLENEFDVPIKYQSISGHDASITTVEMRRRRIDSHAIENRVAELAADADIALAKRVSLSPDPPSVFVKFQYGWGETRWTLSDPKSPHARTEWVGGERGRPETLSPNPIQIKA